MKTPGIKKEHRKNSFKKNIKADKKENILDTSTSWGAVSLWYEKELQKEDTYQNKVILPNLLRNIGNIKGKKVVDIGSGEGFFSREFVKIGASVTGVDVSSELIYIAKNKDTKSKYFVSESHKLKSVTKEKFDVAVCVLAIQNIDKVKETFKEVSSVLKDSGKFLLVINHPSFRNPKKTDWSYDEDNIRQFRKVYEYMSESKVKIDMTPGEKNKYKKKTTVSFHRPLQFYIKAAKDAEMQMSSLEEWISHKESQKGKRSVAEDKARHEIPMFMFLEFTKK